MGRVQAFLRTSPVLASASIFGVSLMCRFRCPMSPARGPSRFGRHAAFWFGHPPFGRDCFRGPLAVVAEVLGDASPVGSEQAVRRVALVRVRGWGHAQASVPQGLYSSNGRLAVVALAL